MKHNIWYDMTEEREELTISVQQSVKIIQKKYFLKWIKENFYLEEEELDWFLEDLIEDDQLLEKLHFVQDIEHCPKGIIITSSGIQSLSFLFFKGGVYTEDVYTAYHELQLYREEAFFIKVNLPNIYDHRLYHALLEDDMMEKEKDEKIADQLLSQLLLEGKVKRVETAINQALDDGDVHRFKELSNQLIQLKKELKNT